MFHNGFSVRAISPGCSRRRYYDGIVWRACQGVFLIRTQSRTALDEASPYTTHRNDQELNERHAASARKTPVSQPSIASASSTPCCFLFCRRRNSRADNTGTDDARPDASPDDALPDAHPDDPDRNSRADYTSTDHTGTDHTGAYGAR